MKKATILTALILAGFAHGQDASHAGEVYVSGHTTKSGKWIDGYYRKRTARRSGRSVAKDSTGSTLTPPAATPPRTFVPTAAGPTPDKTEYVPGHFTKTHKWVEGHFRKPSHRLAKVKKETDILYAPPELRQSHRKKSTNPFGG